MAEDEWDFARCCACQFDDNDEPTTQCDYHKGIALSNRAVDSEECHCGYYERECPRHISVHWGEAVLATVVSAILGALVMWLVL